jgi:hypothetical protein
VPKDHRVRRDDCINSIGLRYGFAVRTLWDHPDNADLKQRRGDPDVLRPGDVVVIPDKRIREESCATEARHRFRRLSVPAKFSIRLLDGDEPRADLAYRLVFDKGPVREGVTDSEGGLEESIPPDVTRGKLHIDETEECFELDFGNLHPVDTDEGARQRLENLMYLRRNAGTPAFQSAVVRFKQDHCGLEVKTDGTAMASEIEDYRTLCDDTRDKLVEVHGS